MGDSRLMVDNLNFEYQGVFKAEDLFGIATQWFQDRGWDMKPSKDHHFHTPDGLAIEWYISPWKKITDYIRLEIKLTVLVHNLKKKKIEVDGKETEVDDAKVLINMNGYFEYDYDMRWEQRPMFLFIRSIMDKYVFASYTKKWEQVFIDDCNDLYRHLQKFLNTYNAPMMSTPMSTVHQTDGHH